MQALSRALADLYDAAEHRPIEEFPREAIRSFRSLVQFDGAAFDAGDMRALGICDPPVNKAFLFAAAAPEEVDPAAPAPAAPPGTQVTLLGDVRSLCRAQGWRSLEAFAERHVLAQMMTGVYGSNRISLFRRALNPFSETDLACLQAFWPHVPRAAALNRGAFLERQLAASEERAAALIRRDGTIEAADAKFRRLLTLEWPNQPDHSVPTEVMQAWRMGHGYAGARIQISMHRQHGYLLGFAVANERLAVLTKTERIVAQQFANGYSNKDIANQLSVSQNTVRSHIAHIYTKLGVHDKAQLANCIARKAGQALVHIQNRFRLEQK